MSHKGIVGPSHELGWVKGLGEKEGRGVILQTLKAELSSRGWRFREMGENPTWPGNPVDETTLSTPLA